MNMGKYDCVDLLPRKNLASIFPLKPQTKWSTHAEVVGFRAEMKLNLAPNSL